MRILSLRDLSLSSEELKEIAKLIAQKRGIKDYESMSKDKLLSAVRASESTEKIREEIKKLHHGFSKSEIKEIKKHLYEIENKRRLSASKKSRKYLLKIEEKVSRLKEYFDYDAEYKGIKDIEGLFDSSLGEDYYKPIIVNGAFGNNYVRYESKGDKDKVLAVNEYLDIIRSQLVDMINDHKIKGEWKIQLTAEIDFISSKPDSDETRTMRTKSDNVRIMIGSERNEDIEELFESLLQKYQEGLEEKMEGSDFVFDSVDALYYDLKSTSLGKGISYMQKRI